MLIEVDFWVFGLVLNFRLCGSILVVVEDLGVRIVGLYWVINCVGEFWVWILDLDWGCCWLRVFVSFLVLLEVDVDCSIVVLLDCLSERWVLMVVVVVCGLVCIRKFLGSFR